MRDTIPRRMIRSLIDYARSRIRVEGEGAIAIHLVDNYYASSED